MLADFGAGRMEKGVIVDGGDKDANGWNKVLKNDGGREGETYGSKIWGEGEPHIKEITSSLEHRDRS